MDLPSIPFVLPPVDHPGSVHLEDEVNSGGVVEVAVEAQHVGVSQVRLNLDFPPKLMLNPRFGQLRLEQHLREWKNLLSSVRHIRTLSNKALRLT